MPANSQSSKDNRQVGIDRILLTVEDRPSPQIGFRHPERRFNLPQIVISTDHFAGRNGFDWQVRDIAFQASEHPGPLEDLLIQLFRGSGHFQEPYLLHRWFVLGQRQDLAFHEVDIPVVPGKTLRLVDRSVLSSGI